MAQRSDSTTAQASRARREPRKDRLVQARVPRQLEETLKQEAQRRRLTVSHLVRNVLEDAFHLADVVVHDVDRIVNDSVTLARRIGGGAGHDRGGAAELTSDGDEAIDDLSHVYAWNEVVLHRSALCSSCGSKLARGHAGLSDARRAPRAWLCKDCIARL